MRTTVLGIITMRREVAARYVRMTRRWVAARNTYRRLHAAPVQNFIALRAAVQRINQLDRGRTALLSDLKSLSD